MSEGKSICSHCHSELNSGRCEYCGTWVDTNFLGKAKKSVGIHPALAKRYASSKEPGVTQTRAPSQVSTIHDGLIPDTIEPAIPGYELLESIGKGAMGSVYRAKHLASGRFAAVKILSTEMSSRADLVARFERESAALSSLRHPNVVAIYDLGSASRVHYFCMEYIEGTTLRRYLKNGPVQLAQAIQFARQILKGLGAAHERGIIHRDLKPENVLVDKGEDRLVLVDFGLAGLMNEAANPHPNLTRSRVTMGTVNYMAPEQHLDAKRVDQRSDLYSVGVIFYECVMGDLPLGRFALPSERGYKAPDLLDKILSRALARDPETRFQTTVQFDGALNELEEALKDFDFTTPAAGERISYAPQPRQSEYPTQWATVPPWVKKPAFSIGATALVAGLVLGIFISKRHPREIVVTPTGVESIHHGIELEALKKNWKSESPVWEGSKAGILYAAKQGSSGHLRRDMSLLVEQDKLKDNTWVSKLSLEKLRLPMSAGKVQHLARESLGGDPEPAAGGVFYVSTNGHRVIGVMAYPDGNCMMSEFKRQDGILKSVQQTSVPCKMKNLVLQARLNPEKNRLEALVDMKPQVFMEVKNLKNEKWQRALGCRNVNCNFEPAL